MKKPAAIVSTISYLILATTTFAQTNHITVNAPSVGYKSLGDFISAALRLAFTVALIAVLVMLIWGALEWIFSGGSKDGINGARNRILHALIGLAVLAVAFAIVAVAGQFVGINILGELPIPSPQFPNPTIAPPVPQASSL